ncbi:hypothetical protein BDY19DRAFT_554277 [Irpex rosettiformis]|uniref:Uncharacterized protein n=1 Tax=Irpex rosettiformis TaxID=378272 RepID=A0ACB8TQB5_9APHY|nr:hypothetical protein BDY19DRAFT_554277 [Irpex rosettiformis]
MQATASSSSSSSCFHPTSTTVPPHKYKKLNGLMADSTGPTMTANRLAMSKALGAAFLSHQVEQLEQKVSGRGSGGAERGGGGNWREGRRSQTYQGRGGGAGNQRRGGGGGGGVKGPGRRNTSGPESERGLFEESRGPPREDKDADVVVVDASVLVHGISHLKKWCREGRQEVVIIPLEALNTLDLLKKGTTSLAQRARAASRILEAQVGTNPRIRVQRDGAFVLWDQIPFTPESTNNSASPEWVRRTICCARWEIEHASTPPSDATAKPKVILAVCTNPDLESSAAAKDNAPPISASPVPLPAPQPNKFEPRSAGTLVHQWAVRAGIQVLQVPPSPQNSGGGGGPPGNASKEGGGRRSGEYGRRSPDDDRAGSRGGRGGGGGGRRNGSHGQYHHHHHQSKPLVERPPAVMAMMEAVSQPSRVVRVLARGEKLDAN